MKAPILLLLVSLAASPLAASPLAAATRNAVESPHATMRELGLEPRALIQRGEEHEQRRSFAPKAPGITTAAQVRAESVTTKPTLVTPRILSSFAGSHDRGMSPSDAAGAVSSKYLLHASNASILAQDRAGN